MRQSGKRYLCLAITGIFATAHAQDMIDVTIKGFDDGVKSTVQNDYQEAVLFAKREAIERAGSSIRSSSTMEDFVLKADMIEARAEAVLMPGYRILDIGYQEDGSYLVILTGQVKEIVPDSALMTALKALSVAPQDYRYDLGANLGAHAITKAYFKGDNQFVIHYAFNQGVMTLNDIHGGIMQLQGSYTTSNDKGTILLDFNADGSASGRWENWLSSGDIMLKHVVPDAAPAATETGEGQD